MLHIYNLQHNIEMRNAIRLSQTVYENQEKKIFFLTIRVKFDVRPGLKFNWTLNIFFFVVVLKINACCKLNAILEEGTLKINKI